MIVSYFKRIYHSKPTAHVNINHLLNLIKNPPEVLVALVDKVRACETKEEIDSMKKRVLPIITWNGKFNYRSISQFEESSGYIYVDVDEKKVSKDSIFSIPYVKAIWDSCSGRGYGLLIRCDNRTKVNHKSTYKSIYTMFKDNGIKIDDLGDLSRSNFMSYDRDILIRDEPMDYEAVEPVKTNFEDISINVDIESIDTYKGCVAAMNIAKSIHSFSKGSRWHFSQVYFGMACRFGVTLHEALSFASSNLLTFEDSEFCAKGMYRYLASSFGTKTYK